MQPSSMRYPETVPPVSSAAESSRCQSGGEDTIDSNLDGVLNSQAYGAVTDVQAILGAPGGKYAPAAKLRQDLSHMVRQAWGSASN